MSSPIIEVHDLVKIYKMGEHEVRALDRVSLQIEQGDFVAIMGPSGSGKSTLMQALGLLESPNSGSYRLEGHEVAGLTDDQLATLRRETVGFIFQQFHLLAKLDALENIRLPLLYTGKTSAGLKKGEELLKMVGLDNRGHHRPNQMSGGQQQRVAIARSLINEPTIIFADEPTGNLDSRSEKDVMKILESLNAQGITIILVTHEDEIGKSAKRLIRMRDGVIVSDERLRPIDDQTKSRDTKSPSTFNSVGVRPHAHSDSNTAKKKARHISQASLGQYFDQGVRTLWANKVRTSLSVLGILIGVGAVVAMLALGTGAQKAIESQLSSLGSNLLSLRAGARQMGGVMQESGSTTRLLPEDAAAIAEIKDVARVSSNISGRGQVTYRNKNWNTQIVAAEPSYEFIHSSTPIIGRFFSQDEAQKRARVALLGATVTRELFEGANPIGEMIRINRIDFQVIGVLPEKGAGGFRDQDDVIIVPLFTGMYRLIGKTYVDNIEIEMKPKTDSQRIEDSVLELMNNRHNVKGENRETAFSIRNMADIQEALSQSSKTMGLLLAAIAGISLIVGGIGIMNIMLVSVTERTREIGLRKALGAQRRDILLQFLTESVIVSALGGVVGIVLGVISVISLKAVTGWTMEISSMSVILSFSFSATIGIVFGLYPAKKASELDPIIALRHD